MPWGEPGDLQRIITGCLSQGDCMQDDFSGLVRILMHLAKKTPKSLDLGGRVVSLVFAWLHRVYCCLGGVCVLVYPEVN